MECVIMAGNIVDQDVDVIVNAWNRNIIPWWLLIPQGVSKAIKKKAGTGPFRELAKAGPIPLGEARITSAGKAEWKAIIHVAGISMLWRASKESIAHSVQNAMKLVIAHQFQSVAFPIIGAGSGGYKKEEALNIMQEALNSIESTAKVIIVDYQP